MIAKSFGFIGAPGVGVAGGGGEGATTGAVAAPATACWFCGAVDVGVVAIGTGGVDGVAEVAARGFAFGGCAGADDNDGVDMEGDGEICEGFATWVLESANVGITSDCSGGFVGLRVNRYPAPNASAATIIPAGMAIFHEKRIPSPETVVTLVAGFRNSLRPQLGHVKTFDKVNRLRLSAYSQAA